MSQNNLDTMARLFNKEAQKYMADHPRPDLAEMFDITAFSNTARIYLEKFGPLQAEKMIELYQRGLEIQKEQYEFLKSTEKMGLGERRLTQIRILDKQFALAKDIQIQNNIARRKNELKFHIMNDNRPISNVLSDPDMVKILAQFPSNISSIKPDNHSPVPLNLFSVQEYLEDMMNLPEVLGPMRKSQEKVQESWKKGLEESKNEKYTIENVFQNFVPKIPTVNSPESYMEKFVAKMNNIQQIDDAYKRKEIGPLEYLYRNTSELKNSEDPILKATLNQIISPVEPLLPSLQVPLIPTIRQSEEFRVLDAALGPILEETYPQEED